MHHNHVLTAQLNQLVQVELAGDGADVLLEVHADAEHVALR